MLVWIFQKVPSEHCGVRAWVGVVRWGVGCLDPQLLRRLTLQQVVHQGRPRLLIAVVARPLLVHQLLPAGVAEAKPVQDAGQASGHR